VSTSRQLSDQLADLFSDIAAPEVHLPPEPVDDNILGALQHSLTHEALADVQSTTTISTQLMGEQGQQSSRPGQQDQRSYSHVDRAATTRQRPILGFKLTLALLIIVIAAALTIAAFSNSLAAVLAAAIFAVILAAQLVQRVDWPVAQLTQSAEPAMITDSVDREPDPTSQLSQVNSKLRERVSLLEKTAEISRAMALILDPQELMQTSVDLICAWFEFYNVSLFLLDDTRKGATVAASTGEVGQQMVAQTCRHSVGDESLVGWVCAYAQPRIAPIAGTGVLCSANPLLPDSRTEMVLPLRIGDYLLGALDIHSSAETAFDEDDARDFQGVADAIGIALQNARLLAETQHGAGRQQLVTSVTNRLQHADTITDVLILALEGLGRTFDLAQATVCLGSENELYASEKGQE
jgi:hypothetical protein